ncbi:MAG TPA: IPExxxVDY family protein [Moheibacter sp.]|nr:IPExxxVDY family protein [Moheibacter sp.]
MSGKTLLIDEAEFIDFELFGILSSYSDAAQFVYHVNMNFGTEFVRSEDLDVLIENQISYYPVFEWEDLQTGLYYNIIKNASYTMNSPENSGSLSTLFDVSPVLISQFKEYNYLLKISGASADGFPLQENTFIQIVTKLDTSSVKTINRLIF